MEIEGYFLEASEDLARETLSLQAASSHPLRLISPDLYALSGVTAEGYPANRYHAGSGVADLVESRAVSAAQRAFKANYANVQPLSCSIANFALFSEFLQPGSKLLSLGLSDGGHLSHGAPMHSVGRIYDVYNYELVDSLIDYDLVRDRALELRPDLIVCGASAYPRLIDYETFSSIASETGALLLADVSHVSGLVVSGCIPSPICHADFVTTSTYKQLFGPRGGLVLSDLSDSGVRRRLDRSIFPGVQGTSDFFQIAMKAKALEFSCSDRFASLMQRVRLLASALSAALVSNGLQILTGGTDTHMVIVDLTEFASGKDVETALSRRGLHANRNLIPGDLRGPKETSGVRLGLTSAAQRDFSVNDMECLADYLSNIVRSVAGKERFSERFAARFRELLESRPLASEFC